MSTYEPKPPDLDDHIRRVVREEIARATPTIDEIRAALSRGIRQASSSAIAATAPLPRS